MVKARLVAKGFHEGDSKIFRDPTTYSKESMQLKLNIIASTK